MGPFWSFVAEFLRRGVTIFSLSDARKIFGDSFIQKNPEKEKIRAFTIDILRNFVYNKRV